MCRRLVLVAAVAAVTLACSGPPTKEREQADEALAAARAADAATYAPDELRTAEAALAQYAAAVDAREYRQALRLAIDARENAYAAAKRATDQKAAAKTDAERLIASLESSIQAAKARVSGSGGSRLGAQATDRLRGKLAAALTALQEARSHMTRQNYRGVVAALTPIEADLRKDLAPPLPAPATPGR